MNDQKGPAEIETALYRYADFATDTNRNRVMDSINDLRAQLAKEVEETAAWRKTATFRAEILSTAGADLKTRTKELAEAQAKITHADEMVRMLSADKKRLEVEAVEWRKDRARLDAIDDNGWEIFRSGNAESPGPIYVVKKCDGSSHTGPTLRMALNKAMEEKS